MEVFGKPTINPVPFYSGKIAGYINWTFMTLSLFKVDVIERNRLFQNDFLSTGIFIAGMIVAVISLLQLGRSTRFGLPTRKTPFMISGIYRYSRNPMYLGFDLSTVATMIYFCNPLMIILGAYSIIIYHFIILGEEKFLENAFGPDYQEYRKKARRYL